MYRRDSGKGNYRKPADAAQTAGGDISRDAVEICLYPGGQSGRFANDAKGDRDLVCWLAKPSIARVV
jgi:hypothetical protein